ncbi:MAG: division/cell wall cluster transcriptional repressor MraZ [Thermaerobacter sp.]|nr:cell division/cell wall cluster transcriptional repressor MraZ [Bacillota bacterium]REJ37526.1 MAG: cell division/cell wall cluster transcriptional repressor MraZ [Bacillota bacterium]
MLIGEYQHTIDAKGRLIMPARFREELGETFIVTRGLDRCLFVYPMDEWRTLENKLKSLPMTQANARAFVRFLFSGATECTLDRQGRILLPSHLREHAGITKDVMIIGVSTRVEIWAREQWQAYVEEAEVSYDQIAETLVDLGI